MAYNRLIGNLGEDVACVYLKKHGFLILDRNYNKKWGELDIVATKNDQIHFIEVKAITGTGKDYRPEENVHEMKTKRLKRVIQTYIAEKKLGNDVVFQFHIMGIYLNEKTRRARVDFMENVIL